VIEDDVWIGFNATILKGVTIGKGAIVGACSVVTKNVEPYSIVIGNPAQKLKTMTQIYKRVRTFLIERKKKKRINSFLNSGKIPWSQGYSDFKSQKIIEAISSESTLKGFESKNIPVDFGVGIDERIVEYPWIFSQLSDEKKLLLDAGSTFNFDYILEQDKLQLKKIHICTFHPESPNFNEKDVSYVYSDLRELPYKNDLFDEIVCQSTIEHIDMDNSIYGYVPENKKTIIEKSFSYLKAIEELIRIQKPGGTLLLTFPFGKFENHIFFQQFDDEMLFKIETIMKSIGDIHINFIKYLRTGWIFASKTECTNIESYNPHTGKGKSDDGAAHCRCVCLIKFTKHR
jgi:SAM-dependent methyltransferase